MDLDNIFDECEGMTDFKYGIGSWLREGNIKSNSECFILLEFSKKRYSEIRNVSYKAFTKIMLDYSSWKSLSCGGPSISMISIADRIDIAIVKMEYNRRVNKNMIPKEHKLDFILQDYLNAEDDATD